MISGAAKVLVVGRTGQVAHELARAAWPDGLTAQFLDRTRLDLARPAEARDAIVAARPQIVVNAAAYTAVDAAESDRDTAFAVNRDGPAALAEACAQIGAPLVHFSTDYVFDGSKAAPYTEDDTVNPLSVYGASKEAGEAAIRARLPRHVILRTAWVYSPVGHNFVKTMLRLGAERETLRVVADQRGCPTAAADLAAAVAHVCAVLLAGRDDCFGTFHLCGGGATTWHGFAVEIFRQAARRGRKTPRAVEPIATEDYPTPAPRPRNSVLDCAKFVRTYGLATPPWQPALAACIDEITGAGARLPHGAEAVAP